MRGQVVIGVIAGTVVVAKIARGTADEPPEEYEPPPVNAIALAGVVKVPDTVVSEPNVTVQVLSLALVQPDQLPNV
jgi:hypothetical protein